METTTLKKETLKKLDSSRIMDVGMGFWASKTLLTAVHLGLFTLLGKQPLSASDIKRKLGLHDRGVFDFLDALVALKFLRRSGIKGSAMYSNAKETSLFLDKNKSGYVGGILEMSNNHLYPAWNELEQSLKTGKPIESHQSSGHSVFQKIYSDPNKLLEFQNAMSGWQKGNFSAFAKKFDFSDYRTLCDIGGGAALLSALVTTYNEHMHCMSFDLGDVEFVAQKTVEEMGVSSRVDLISGDFFKSDFPKADVITMGNILHDWGLKDKMKLIKKAYEALPVGGAFVVIESIIDSGRKDNYIGLLSSLNMLLETEEGFDFTEADFDEWTSNAGFKRTEMIPLSGPTSAAIAYK